MTDIVQIIPGDKWFARYMAKSGPQHFYDFPVVCWALTPSFKVVPLVLINSMSTPTTPPTAVQRAGETYEFDKVYRDD